LPEVVNERKAFLLAEKAYQLIRHKRMALVDKKKLQQDIAEALNVPNFNLYAFVNGLTDC